MPKKKLKSIRRTFTPRGGNTIDKMFATKKDADEWYSEMRRRADRVSAGLAITRDNVQMAVTAARWIEGRSKSKDYWEQDSAKMRKCMVPALGGLLVREITKGDCESALHGYRLTAKQSNATFNRYRACLHTFFEYLIEEGYRETNPVTKIEMLEEQQRAITVTDADVEKYLAKAREQKAKWFLPFMVLAMNAGPRAGELLGFNISDYDPSLGFMEITKRYQVTLKRMKEGTKGGGKRDIPLNDTVTTAIDAYLLASPHKAPATPLFHDAKGNRASARTLNDIHRRVATAAGLSDKVRPYDITRHKYATKLSQQTGNMRLVQAVLGHSTTKMTERYAHKDRAFLMEQASAVSVGGGKTEKPGWEKDGTNCQKRRIKDGGEEE